MPVRHHVRQHSGSGDALVEHGLRDMVKDVFRTGEVGTVFAVLDMAEGVGRICRSGSADPDTVLAFGLPTDAALRPTRSCVLEVMVVVVVVVLLSVLDLREMRGTTSWRHLWHETRPSLPSFCVVFTTSSCPSV